MKIAAVFTGIGGLVEAVDRTFREEIEDCEVFNIIDDGILGEVIRANCVTDTIRERVRCLYRDAAAAGADVIVCTCSSIGETVENTGIENIPIIRIDEAMAREAVKSADRIGVIATLKSTVEPTCRLIERIGEETGKPVKTEKVIAGDLLSLLKGGKMQEALEMASGLVRSLSEHCGAVVLAQASMAGMRDALQKASKVPVYASPALCARALKEKQEVV